MVRRKNRKNQKVAPASDVTAAGMEKPPMRSSSGDSPTGSLDPLIPDGEPISTPSLDAGPAPGGADTPHIITLPSGEVVMPDGRIMPPESRV